jgi:hypothetical protein
VKSGHILIALTAIFYLNAVAITLYVTSTFGIHAEGNPITAKILEAGGALGAAIFTTSCFSFFAFGIARIGKKDPKVGSALSLAVFIIALSDYSNDALALFGASGVPFSIACPIIITTAVAVPYLIFYTMKRRPLEF